MKMILGLLFVFHTFLFVVGCIAIWGRADTTFIKVLWTAGFTLVIFVGQRSMIRAMVEESSRRAAKKTSSFS